MHRFRSLQFQALKDAEHDLSHMEAKELGFFAARLGATQNETYLRALAHFAHWMSRCQLAADQIDEALVEQFLQSHLPRCDCHATALRDHGELRASLAHLLALLREQGVILDLPGPSGPIAEELHRFNVHMRDARGLGVGTRTGRLAIVSRLLLCKFAGSAIAIGELSPEDVRGFIATELTRVNSVSHASALAAVLRAYFRYRATCGDALHALLGVISSPARWSLANLKLVEQLVRRHPNVELLMAPSGGLGLDMARSHPPDLLLLDIHLPDIDGFQVLARLRADSQTRHIPVVAVTAQAMPDDVKRVSAAGFDGYLAKPLDLANFDALLNRMLSAAPAQD